MKTSIRVVSSGKEYPDMSKDQIIKMVEYLKQGFSEEEAKAKAKAMEEVK
jgi:hypothetical protein